MAPSQTEIESQIIELTDKSFKTFCTDISGMFGMDMVCKKQEVKHETVDDLQMRFENLAVVYSVKAEGILEGTFQMVLDRNGLFILGGVVAMHPGQMILEDITSGSLDKAEKESNVLNEVGTALVGSWDRVFRKGLDGHSRFVMTNTFIGNPWDKVEEKIGLKTNEDLVYVPYDMTIGPYPTFKCGVIFPKTIFGGVSESGVGQPVPVEEKAGEDTEETKESEEFAAAEKVQPESEEQVETEGTARVDTEETTEAEESATADQARPEAEEQEDAEEKAESEESAAVEGVEAEVEEAVASDESVVEQEGEAAEEQEAGDVEEEKATVSETSVRKKRPISDAIKKMAKSSAVLPGEFAPSATAEEPGGKDTLLTVFAKDVMQKEVVWGKPDDSVQQALSKMQQHNTGYIMIGKEQVAEGIVSKSDLAGALSPYLRNIFAKWRRPLDDATLQIKIKWIMSKPTCTISPDTSLLKIIENMCQIDKKCLPVVDEEGKVRGLVTVFDIFRSLLKHSFPK